MKYCNECHQTDEHMPGCPDDPRQDLAPVTAEDVKATPPRQYPLVEQMMAYEQGDLSIPESLELFSHLIRTGMAWGLQGSYGRAARTLIDSGVISSDGVIDLVAVEDIMEGLN